jgi:glycosyltransferase involved in cell wall biosynthesis
LKIAFLAYEYPPYSFGGIGSFSKDLTQGLSLAGIEVVVIAFSPLRTITRENVNAHLTVIRVPGFNFSPRHFWWQTCNRHVIRNLIRTINPDLIHANSLVATLPLQITKEVFDVPQIVTIHGDYRRIREIYFANSDKLLQPRDFFTYILFEPLNEQLLLIETKTVDCVVAVSRHVKYELSSRFKNVNLATIYNGVTIEPSISAENVNEYGALEATTFGRKDRKVRIAYIGRLFWIKGITFALNAFARLMRLYHPQNVEFSIYGDGPLKGIVKKFVKSHESSNPIHYYGEVSRSQIINQLREIDIVVYPSLYEACPIALLEALSFGKAVVVNNMSWSEEFIKDRHNGLRVDTCNPTDFAKSLFELIENKELRIQISQNARKDVQNFSVSNEICQYINLYQNLL